MTQKLTLVNANAPSHNKIMIRPESWRRAISDGLKKAYANGLVHPNIGTHRSKATKKKISLANTGKKHPWRPLSEIHKQRIGNANGGEKNGMYGKFGQNNPAWKGGHVDKRGYMRHAENRYANYEHRKVAEKALGRSLKYTEIVHHVNCISGDNRPRNLLICDRGYHGWLHKEMARRYAKEHLMEMEAEKQI